MPAPTQALSRVERALKRLGLLNKSCDYIRTATGMDVPGTTDTGFNAWVAKLEMLPAKSAQAHIYYTTKKAKHTKKYKAELKLDQYEAYIKAQKEIDDDPPYSIPFEMKNMVSCYPKSQI